MKSSKKSVCDKLVAKLDVIDTSGFVLKAKYDKDKSDLEKKINDSDKRYLMPLGLLKNRL